MDESGKTRSNTLADRTLSDGSPRRTPAQMILRWTALSVLGILAAGALIFVGDTVVFFLRGKPSEQIVVTRYMAAPLKGDNTEFYYEGTGPESCAKSLFAQNGWSPCWYLRRHPMYAEPA
jgi:hypothetical protein